MMFEDRLSRKLSAEDLETQGQVIREMSDLLRAFIAGDIDHERVQEWAWSTYAGYGKPPVVWGIADHVLHAMLNAATRLHTVSGGCDARVGEYAFRPLDAREYIDWLERGVGFIGEEKPLVHLRRPMHELQSRFGRPSHRYVVEGIGWYCELRFCASASSRAFVALTRLEGDAVLEVHARVGTDPTLALRDLVELLALDDDELLGLDERVDLSALPRWELDGVGMFRSRAKAVAAQADLARRQGLPASPNRGLETLDGLQVFEYGSPRGATLRSPAIMID
jgi:hypothetical protein